MTPPAGEPRGVPQTNPRVVAYVLLNLGAILVAVGVGLRYGAAWALIVLGAALVVEAVMLVDLPRSTPRTPPAEARPERHRRIAPVFPTATPDPQQPAARARPDESPPAGPAGASVKG